MWRVGACTEHLPAGLGCFLVTGVCVRGLCLLYLLVLTGCTQWLHPACWLVHAWAIISTSSLALGTPAFSPLVGRGPRLLPVHGCVGVCWRAAAMCVSFSHLRGALSHTCTAVLSCAGQVGGTPALPRTIQLVAPT
jgi:hypothetical protein